ncbi:MAG: glycine cleavage system protein GcvH [Anaerolineae bacterium]|nr:glycine cleavage system protein GcvH [Anaerolineae bacterium]MDW8070076.1 glycine cleavage system protein GcvH [Anaerolineae bacterium]
MKLDANARYTDSHEWLRKEGDVLICGITDYAQEELSDVVYVELPEVGDSLKKGERFGVIESVKAASDLYMPVSGEIIAVNQELVNAPELVNKDPYGKGWMIKIRPSNPAEWDMLLSPEEYEKSVAGA